MAVGDILIIYNDMDVKYDGPGEHVDDIFLS